jgi:hypothetical protein
LFRSPGLDALAQRGVRFANAFVQSGVCGPSRMSMYTGRYVSSHGATWNRVPLSIGEITLGEYLRDAGDKLVGALKGISDRPQMIQTAFRAVLSRDAQLEELEAIVHYLAAREDRPIAAIQQVVWALITDSEFRFNY